MTVASACNLLILLWFSRSRSAFCHFIELWHPSIFATAMVSSGYPLAREQDVAFLSLRVSACFARKVLTLTLLPGSLDNWTWEAYEYRHYAGDLARRPTMFAPYQPRLDHQVFCKPERKEEGDFAG